MSPQRQKRANSGQQAIPPEQQVPVVGQAPVAGPGAGNAAAQEALKGKLPAESAQGGAPGAPAQGAPAQGAPAQGGPAQAVPAQGGAAPNQGGAQAELHGAEGEEAQANGPAGAPAQRQAGAPPADPTAGPTPAGPEAAAPAAAAPAVAAAAVDQGQAAPGEAQPKSEAEIDQAIAGVQGQAQAQAPGEDEAKGEGEAAQAGAQEAAAQGQGGAPGAGQAAAPGQGPAAGGKGPAVAPAQGGGGPVPFAPWSGLKGGFPWDQEIAMRELFKSQQGAGAGGAGGAGAAPPAAAQQPMSRLELVGQALGGGAMAGAKEGAVSVVIDTALNMASSKVPYLSGFVEMGRLIYDPKKYGEDTLKGLTGGGKFGSGWEKVTSGNPIDMIEGVLDWGDAIAGIIATLSNICWIVAGLGFILSWIPGMQWLIPFVALTAKWAMLLGTIGTAINLGLSVLRLLVMGLRTLDILFLEADPEAARAKAAGLQEQTTKFTQDFVQRAGDSARGRLSGHLAQKGQQGQGNNPAPAPAPAPASPPPAWSRALGIMTGSFGTEHGSSMGSGFNQTLGAKRRGEVREDFDNTRKATSEAAARGQTTGQRIAGLEARGVQVYVGDRHRDYTNRQLEKRGQADPTLDLAPARQRLALAQADYDKAKEDRSRTRDELQRAQAELNAAQQRLREAQARGGPTEAELKAELATRKQLLDSYDQDVRTARAQGDEADARFNAARAMQQQAPSPENLARMQGALADKQRALESERRAIAGQQEAAQLHLEGIKQLHAVQAPPAEAQIAEQRRNEANGAHSQASAGAEDKRRARSRARGDLQTAETPTALKAEQQWQERQQARADYKWYLDFGGNGPTGDNGPFGHNKAEGVMGAGTGLLVTMAKDQGALADPEKMAKPGEGRQIGPDYDLFGGGGDQAAAGGNPGAEAAKARVQAAMASLSALPAPPMGAPNQVDGAYAAYQSLDAEEQRLKGQKVALAEGKAIGAQAQAELQGGAAVLDGARQTGAAIQAEADAKLAKQQELSSKAGEVGAKATEGGGKAGESQGLLGSFIGGFLGLMSKIPSRFVGNAGAGSAGAQRLGQAPAQMTGGASTGGEAAAAMSAAAATQGAQTQEAKAQTTAAQGQIDANKATITTKQAETQTGVAEMTQADAQADAELARIAAEKERLKAEHQAAGSGAAAWATGHAASRTNLQAELAAAVAAAEALQGGGAGR